jgi:hypothetical protein
MHHVIGTLIIGALAGGLTSRCARLRPAVRGIVKGGIAAKRKIVAVSNTARVEMQKLVEEARADLNGAGTEQHS